MAQDLNGRIRNLGARFRYKNDSKPLGDLEQFAPRENVAVLWCDLCLSCRVLAKTF
jgi:hypothetical protein